MLYYNINEVRNVKLRFNNQILMLIVLQNYNPPGLLVHAKNIISSLAVPS